MKMQDLSLVLDSIFGEHLKEGFQYLVHYIYLPILGLHLTWFPVLVDLDPGNWLIRPFDAHILK